MLQARSARRTLRAAIAVAAAYAFALHAIVLAMALGAAGPALPADAVHALCAPDGSGSDLPASPPAHVHADACCIFHGFGAALPQPASSAIQRAAVPGSVLRGRTGVAFELPRLRTVPLGSRAPPRLV
jgi:hypothetical protein